LQLVAWLASGSNIGSERYNRYYKK